MNVDNSLAKQHARQHAEVLEREAKVLTSEVSIYEEFPPEFYQATDRAVEAIREARAHLARAYRAHEGSHAPD